jgi:ribose/xylose/arabinose/galactoside ABC-type transport system permease subunit
MPLGRFLITLGLLLVAAGVLVLLLGRLPIRLGRLPGDLYIHGKNSTFYFPIVTCLLISVVLSVAMWILRRP